jgi:rhomboid-like protein
MIRRFNQRINRLDGKNILYSIIGINATVFGMWQYSINDRQNFRFMHNNFTVSADGVFRQKKFHTLITSVFSQKDAFHLFANMFTLYFFGKS